MFPESPLIHDLIESDTDACKSAGKSMRMARNGFFAEENMYLDIVGHDEVGARGKKPDELHLIQHSQAKW